MTEAESERRRRYRRRTVRVLVEYVSDAGVCCDTATTLGAGGMFIQTDAPLAIGETIKLSFQLPGGSQNHEFEGRVVWANRPSLGSSGTAGTAGTAGMGIGWNDPRASQRLANEIEDLAENGEVPA
jgi:Tfp pilus assembly protein PilZ